jgi:hypothetical protein
MMNSDWRALEETLGPERCADFMFMGRVGDLYLYKHINTRRYLSIALDGACFRYTPEGHVPIDRDAAIRWVFSLQFKNFTLER